MDQSYDVIILGTGLKECILSGLLSVSGKKVLHMDRNDYYGAESASLNLAQLKQHLEGKGEDVAKKEVEGEEFKTLFGRSKDYNIDLCPKFIMANGDLVKMLLHTKVTRYLEFKCADASYVARSGKLCEVPMTPKQALSSDLMSLMQKNYYKMFLQWLIRIDPANEKTWPYKGTFGETKLDLKNMTPRELFTYFKLDEKTIQFTAHAIALYNNDSYLDKKEQTLELIRRCKLYADSLARYDKSPYLYPMWGLGGLPEGFSRLAAVHGGTYMLRSKVHEILYNEDGSVKGVKAELGDEGVKEAYCKQLISDPTYLVGSDKVKANGFIARWIGILKAPPQGTKKGVESAQIIFPSGKGSHKADIYCAIVSKGLECAPQGRYVTVVSTRVASKGVEDAKKVLANCEVFKLLGGSDNILAEWMSVRECFMPCNHGAKDNVFIPSSPDASTHFQQAAREVQNIFHSMTGKPVNLDSSPDSLGEDQ